MVYETLPGQHSVRIYSEETISVNTGNQNRVDLVLPVYNEKGNLEKLYEEIDAALSSEYNWKALFVDDGSTDGSTKLIRKLADKDDRVVLIRFAENSGQSAAFSAGFEYSTAPLVVTLDADGQNDPADIPRMIGEMGETDMVAGYRENRRDSWWRKLGSRLGNSVRNWLTGDNIIDTGCSLKVFRNEVVKSFPVFEGMHRFFPTLARIEGYSITQVPTNHRSRVHGETKYSNMGRLKTTLWDVWAVCWLQDRHLDYEVEEG
ncbi:MAG: glycosyltransferase family 2 protein [bacterium]